MNMKKRKIEKLRDVEGCINLNKLENYREKGEIVEGSNAKAWFKVDGVRFLFKEYNSSLVAFGEILYSVVARMCGIRCAEYDFAKYNGHYGTISYDFLNKNEAYYSFFDLTTQFNDNRFKTNDVKTNRELLILHNNKYNNLFSIMELLGELFDLDEAKKLEIIKELVGENTLDTIFDHRDRTLWNHGTIVNEESDRMRLAPIHDNAKVLQLEKGKEYIEEMIVKIINNNGMENVNRVDLDEDKSLSQLKQFYNDSEEEIRKIIESVIKSIDVEKAIKETLKICKIGEIEAFWVKAMLNYRKISILKCIESAKINNDVAQKPNVAFSRRK